MTVIVKHDTTLFSHTDRSEHKMLLQSCIPALSLTHGAVASSYRNQYARPCNHVLRNGREYPSPQIEVSAVSGHTHDNLATAMNQQNNNNNTAMTFEQSNSAATSNTAEQAKMWKRKERENSQSSIVKEWIARERMV